MKNTVTTIIICFIALNSFAQQGLSLKIIEGASNPNSDLQQFYLLEVTNNTVNTENVHIKVGNVNCSNASDSSITSSPIDTDQALDVYQASVQHMLYDETQTNQLNSLNIAPNNSSKFYLKIYRNENSLKGKWNCKLIMAVSGNEAINSEPITITTLIPNENNKN